MARAQHKHRKKQPDAPFGDFARLPAPQAVSPVRALVASCTAVMQTDQISVLGPGGLRFGDHWRMGLLLEALRVAVSMSMLLGVWPL